jgi:ketosteroid isomerase-like protein
MEQIMNIIQEVDVMTNADAIKAFTDMLKAGDHEEAAKSFNAPGIVSIEAMEGPMARIEGTEALRQKSEWWYGNHEVHGVTTEGPYVNGDQFAVIFDMDFTQKASGQRVKAKEVGLYTMKDGKVVEEKFYYST